MPHSPRPVLRPFREVYPLTREVARQAVRDMARGRFVSRAEISPTCGQDNLEPLARSEYQIELELREHLAAVAGPDTWTLR
jgi:hypothetical protein